MNPLNTVRGAITLGFATLASRTNFALSIPMLLCMGSATHGLPF